MVKSNQESEQKNLIALLQRQNISLESKCEKLQTHLKTLEIRIRDLMGTVEAKIKLINDREDAKLKQEAEYESKLSECQAQISILSQEKEHLRHKVIRLNLNAKGEGGNTIDNMIKRISRETSNLQTEFEHLSNRHDTLIAENQVLLKKLTEREKFADFMEKEVTRRTEEYISMTNTFEEFIAGRAKQSRKERAKKLPKLDNGTENSRPSEYAASMPEKPRSATADFSTEKKQELERGKLYLKKFKTLSRAFATGNFRILPSGQINQTSSIIDAVPGPWQKTALYSKMEDANLAMAKLYKEPVKTARDPSSKPTVYSSISEGNCDVYQTFREKNFKLILSIKPPTTKVYTDGKQVDIAFIKQVKAQVFDSKFDINKQVLVGKSIPKN
ncbi:hypothetical protein HK100_003382 [Physocladia obscura]|uniref:Uncharacterized protein n=1 Tax=Physocladia obscura TaxID=109957 RepID=A0AAD5T7K8_9FUNG|nr:hypothetical protein HK100_003382 [Physocladia obscura]